MPVVTVSETAAGSAVGTDLLTNAPPNIKRSPNYRKVDRIAVVGSTNPRDAAVDLFYGDAFVGRFYNTTGGANIVPLDARDLIKVVSDLVMEPNEDLTVVISDAGATNVLAVTLVITDMDAEAIGA